MSDEWSHSFTLGGGATKSSITDAVGLADAAEVTFPGEIYTYVPTSALSSDKPIWVEFDLLQGSSSALTAITVQVGLDSASNGEHLRRTYTLDASWRTRRYR